MKLMRHLVQYILFSTRISTQIHHIGLVFAVVLCSPWIAVAGNPANNSDSYTIPSIAVFTLITCNRTFMRCPSGWEDCNGQVIDTNCSNGVRETVYYNCCRKIHDSCPHNYAGRGIDRKTTITLDGKHLKWELLRIDCCKKETKACSELKPGYSGTYQGKTCIVGFQNIPALDNPKTKTEITYLGCHKCEEKHLPCPQGYQGEKVQRTCWHLELKGSNDIVEVVDPGYPKIVKNTCSNKVCEEYKETCHIKCNTDCRPTGAITREKCYNITPEGGKRLLYDRIVQNTCKCECSRHTPPTGSGSRDSDSTHDSGCIISFGVSKTTVDINEHIQATWQGYTKGHDTFKTCRFFYDYPDNLYTNEEITTGMTETTLTGRKDIAISKPGKFIVGVGCITKSNKECIGYKYITVQSPKPCTVTFSVSTSGLHITSEQHKHISALIDLGDGIQTTVAIPLVVVDVSPYDTTGGNIDISWDMVNPPLDDMQCRACVTSQDILELSGKYTAEDLCGYMCSSVTYGNSYNMKVIYPFSRKGIIVCCYNSHDITDRRMCMGAILIKNQAGW